MVRIRKVPLTVIGVLDRKGQSMSGQDQDDLMLLPITTARKRILGATALAKSRSVGSITIKVRQGTDMKAAEERMRELLRQRHRLQTGQDDDFNVRNLSEILQAQEASSKVLAMLLAAVASVSLLVGGIGIMNIMLVSVTERTREIGLRMAVGARGRDILTQFLVEAVTLSLIGGLIGILLGTGGSFLIGAARRMAHRAIGHRHRPGGGLCRRGRHLLRLLSGPQGREPVANRSAAVRVARIPMANEIELKLALPESAQRAFLRHPLLKSALEKHTDELFNIYYDTPDLALRELGIALRLRRQGNIWLQTVKCAGSSAGGLSTRPEWETPYGGQFDFSPVDDAAIRAQLERINGDGQLAPLFETNFRRVTWRFDGVLLVLDRGWIIAGDRREAISELELELAGGEVGQLFALAERLKERLPIVPALRSKAERGLRLRQRALATSSRRNGRR